MSLFPSTNQDRPSEQLLHYSRCPMGVNDLFQVRAVAIHTNYQKTFHVVTKSYPAGQDIASMTRPSGNLL